MSNVYERPTAKESDDVLRGRIVTRRRGAWKGRKAWDDRDIFSWSHQVPGIIAVESRTGLELADELSGFSPRMQKARED